MKLLAGWTISAGLVLLVSAANAQAPTPLGEDRSPDRLVSDFDGPYGAPLPAPPPYAAPYDATPYGSEGPYGYAPELLPPREVYAVLRDNGFVPLGPPYRRGYTYEISAIDPDGEDGRLIIDARTGRIMRFMPADWEEGTDNSRLRGSFGTQAALRWPATIRGVPRPPAPIPHVASRAVPLPARKPTMAAIPAKSAERTPHVAVEKPVEATAKPQTAAVTPPPANVGTATVGETKPPEPQIKPTGPMPPVQGFE